MQTDQTLDHLTTQLRDKNIRYDDMRKVGDTQILVRNLAPDSSRDVPRSGQFEFPRLGRRAGPGRGFRLSADASSLPLSRRFKTQTMSQSEDTIRRRIDALGLDGAVCGALWTGRQRDHRRAARRRRPEPRQVRDSSRRAARAAPRRRTPIPIRQKRRPWQRMAAFCRRAPNWCHRRRPTPPARASWYLVDRSPIITGRDLRSATALPSTDNPGSYEVSFTLSTEAARRFGPFTEQNVGRPMAIVLDHKVESAPVIQSRIEDSRAGSPAASGSKKPMTWRWFCALAPCPASIRISRSAPWGRRSAPIPSAMACRPRS